jgi:cytochrome c2
LSRKGSYVGWILTGVSGCALLLGVLRWRHEETKPFYSVFLAGNPSRGVHVFEDKGCVYCHAVNGWGNQLAPDLGFERPPRSDLSQLVTAMWNHAPKMWEYMRTAKIDYPSFRRGDMADLFAFLYVARYLEEPGDSARGRRVFEAKGCIRCHGLGRVKSKMGPNLSAMSGLDTPILWAQAMWNHAPAMEAEMQRLGLAWPAFEDLEMNDLLAYVREATSGLRRESQYVPADPEHGRQLFQSKSCIACHSVSGKGGRIGPELGGQSRHSLSLVQFSGLMWNHSPKMWRAAKAEGVPRPSFEEKEMADLLAFLCSLRYFEPGGSRQKGESVFAQRGCSRCHGSGAEGTPLGPALRQDEETFTSVTLGEALWQHGPEMYQRAQQVGVPWPALVEGDVGDLLAFLNTPIDHGQ